MNWTASGNWGQKLSSLRTFSTLKEEGNLIGYNPNVLINGFCRLQRTAGCRWRVALWAAAACSILPAAAILKLESEETFILCFAPEHTATAYLQSTLCKWSVSVSAEHAPPCVQQMQYLVQQGRANRDIAFLCRKKCCQKYLPPIYLHTFNLHIRSQHNITSCKYQLWLGAAGSSG